jgi:hypothetical protein
MSGLGRSLVCAKALKCITDDRGNRSSPNRSRRRWLRGTTRCLLSPACSICAVLQRWRRRWPLSAMLTRVQTGDDLKFKELRRFSYFISEVAESFHGGGGPGDLWDTSFSLLSCLAITSALHSSPLHSLSPWCGTHHDSLTWTRGTKTAASVCYLPFRA